MKIAQVSFHRFPGDPPGSELLASYPLISMAARAVARCGAEVTVIQAAGHDESLHNAEIRYELVNEVSAWRALRRCERIRERCREIDPDVIVVQGMSHPVETAWLSWLGKPVLLQYRCERPRRGWRAAARRWCFRRAKGVLAHSRAAAPDFGAVAEVPVGTSFMQPLDRASARSATGVSGDPAILWVGALTGRKDPRTALQALGRVAARQPGTRLWMVFHEDELLAEAEAHIAQAGLGDHVALVGSVPHHRMHLFMSAADVFLTTSRHECGGLALIEALSCGARPVATAIPAHEKTLAAWTGSCFQPGDHSAAALEIERVFSSRTRQEVTAYFEAELSPDVLGARYLRACRELLER